MIRVITLLQVLFCTVPATAQERVLDGEGIRALLTEAEVITPKDGKKIRQVFYADRRTRYDDGAESWGLWEVRGDSYCSNWPPSASWVCYAMHAWTRDGLQWVAWTGDSGTRYEGYIRP